MDPIIRRAIRGIRSEGWTVSYLPDRRFSVKQLGDRREMSEAELLHFAGLAGAPEPIELTITVSAAPLRERVRVRYRLGGRAIEEDQDVPPGVLCRLPAGAILEHVTRNARLGGVSNVATITIGKVEE